MAEAAAKDALALIAADHRSVEKMFEKFDALEDIEEKERLVARICEELIIHTMIEEELFYPALRGEVEDEDLDEAYVEHDGAKVLIAELMNSSAKHDFYDAKVRVLAEEIRHHVQEEEKAQESLFKQAREAGVDLKDLGRALAARKQELKEQFEAEGPPMPVTRTFVGAELELGAPRG